MPRSNESVWLPLGSALVIDWKHLGRSNAARGATAWVGHLDEDPVILRAWGEETTSYFDFVFLNDERVAGSIIVGCSRTEPGKLRVKVTFEIEGLLSFVETNDFKEHPRTMLLSPVNRALEMKIGAIAGGPPRLSAASAEILEIAPDGALMTPCGVWIASLLRAARDQVQGREAVAVATAAVAAAPPRARTEQMVRPPARETLDGPKRPAAATADGARRDGAMPAPAQTPVEPMPARSAAAPKPKAPADGPPPAKLLCATNSGERFEIAADETYIGRSKQCGIVLKSQRVSRKHACVTREADGFYINDLGAANGIWQGSEKIDREKIQAGDEYIVGDVVLSFSFA